MNVLIISSSPRKGGNSDLLCDQFMTGAVESGHQVTKVNLRDLTIGYCTGCGYCFEKHRCTQKDDMAPLLEQMIAADVIVLASPIYFYTMCGQLKTMIDRSCARYTEIRNKEFHYILTAADTSAAAMDKTVVEFSGFLECLNGAVCKGVIAGTGAWNKGDIKKSPMMRTAYEAGLNL